jgi:hypothetical protein
MSRSGPLALWSAARPNDFTMFAANESHRQWTHPLTARRSLQSQEPPPKFAPQISPLLPRALPASCNKSLAAQLFPESCATPHGRTCINPFSPLPPARIRQSGCNAGPPRRHRHPRHLRPASPPHLFARTCPLRSVDCRRQAARQREAQQSSFAAAGFCRAPPLRSAARAPLSCSGMQHFESDNARSAARAATTRAHESQWLNPLSRSRPSRPTELAIPTVSRLSGRRDFLLAVFWGIWATPQVEPNPNKSRQNEDGAFLSQSW